MNRIITRATKADKLSVGDIIVTENARGTQFRHPVSRLAPCLTDNHSVHVGAPNGSMSCYSVLPDVQVAV
jgi:hypothetical protein